MRKSFLLFFLSVTFFAGDSFSSEKGLSIENLSLEQFLQVPSQDWNQEFAYMLYLKCEGELLTFEKKLLDDLIKNQDEKSIRRIELKISQTREIFKEFNSILLFDKSYLFHRQQTINAILGVINTLLKTSLDPQKEVLESSLKHYQNEKENLKNSAIKPTEEQIEKGLQKIISLIKTLGILDSKILSSKTTLPLDMQRAAEIVHKKGFRGQGQKLFITDNSSEHESHVTQIFKGFAPKTEVESLKSLGSSVNLSKDKTMIINRSLGFALNLRYCYHSIFEKLPFSLPQHPNFLVINSSGNDGKNLSSPTTTPFERYKEFWKLDQQVNPEFFVQDIFMVRYKELKDHLIFVGALDNGLNIEPFSNRPDHYFYTFGTTPADDEIFIDSQTNKNKVAQNTISALGGNVLSNIDQNKEDPAYKIKSGTSMAAPMVTGIAGLVQSIFGFQSSPILVEILLNSADKTFVRKGKNGAQNEQIFDPSSTVFYHKGTDTPYVYRYTSQRIQGGGLLKFEGEFQRLSKEDFEKEKNKFIYSFYFSESLEDEKNPPAFFKKLFSTSKRDVEYLPFEEGIYGRGIVHLERALLYSMICFIKKLGEGIGNLNLRNINKKMESIFEKPYKEDNDPLMRPLQWFGRSYKKDDWEKLFDLSIWFKGFSSKSLSDSDKKREILDHFWVYLSKKRGEKVLNSLKHPKVKED